MANFQIKSPIIMGWGQKSCQCHIYLSYACRGLLFWSVNHISIIGNSEWSDFSIVKSVQKIVINYPNLLFGTKLNKTVDFLTTLHCNDTTSVIWIFGTFSLFCLCLYLFLGTFKQLYCFFCFKFKHVALFYLKNYWFLILFYKYFKED